MAKLPGNKKKKRLVDMCIGELGFTVPWALWVDEENECFINEDFEISQSSGGTVQLKIKKTVNGYIAYIYDVKYKWSPCAQHGFLNTDESLCYGRVVAFKSNSDEKADPSVADLLAHAILVEDYELAAKLKKELS